MGRTAVVAAALLQFCAIPTSALAATTLIRAPIDAALRGDSHLALALDLLQRDDFVNRLIEAEFSESAPVLVPLCWSIAEWSEAELSELQWPPLVAAQQARSAELRALAKEHAQPEHRIFGRFRGAQALLTALELAHCHAMPLDGELWLLPETAGFERSAPQGASLTLCSESGDLLLIEDEEATRAAAEAAAATSAASAARANADKEQQPQLLNFIFTGLLQDDGDGDDEVRATIGSGVKSNDELLMSQGWADEGLACDAFELPEEVLRASALAALGGAGPLAEQEKVLEGLRRVGSLPASGFGEVRSGGGVSEHLARSVRALCLTAGDVQEHGGVEGCVKMLRDVPSTPGDACGDAASSGTPTATTAMVAARVLATACDSLLERFPTSAAEDEELLQQLLWEDRAQLSEHRRVQCIRSRLSRKRCLTELRDACAAN